MKNGNLAKQPVNILITLHISDKEFKIPISTDKPISTLFKISKLKHKSADFTLIMNGRNIEGLQRQPISVAVKDGICNDLYLIPLIMPHFIKVKNPTQQFDIDNLHLSLESLQSQRSFFRQMIRASLDQVMHRTQLRSIQTFPEYPSSGDLSTTGSQSPHAVIDIDDDDNRFTLCQILVSDQSDDIQTMPLPTNIDNGDSIISISSQDNT